MKLTSKVMIRSIATAHGAARWDGGPCEPLFGHAHGKSKPQTSHQRDKQACAAEIRFLPRFDGRELGPLTDPGSLTAGSWPTLPERSFLVSA